MTAATNLGVYVQNSSKAVLCLSHDETMLQVRRLLLESFGFTVLAANSVEHAEDMAEGSCPGMLLMDTSYPGTTIEQVATRIKRVCPAVITVVLSPYFAVRSGSEGAIDRFFAQDDPPASLVAKLRELFDAHNSETRADNAIM